jgi:hypothetical protein
MKIVNQTHFELLVRNGRKISDLRIRFIAMLLLATHLFGCTKDLETKKPEVSSRAATSSLAAQGSPNDFTIAVLPDTQNYMSGYFSGTEAMFTAQINWIKNNVAAQNIAYVIGLGDITEHGDAQPAEWTKAKNGYYSLESTNIPYGLAVGNHDQAPLGGHILTATTNQYNTYFGVSHFTGKPYYGGHYGSKNNSHYDLFSAGGKDFIVVYIEYDEMKEDTSSMNTWAYNLLGTYASRKAIVVTHSMATDDSTPIFTAQGSGIYNRLKTRSNLFMFLGGHVFEGALHGEAFKEVQYGNHTMRTYVSDYQGRVSGGNGLMRLMRISVDNDDVAVKTYSPVSNTYETGVNSQFTKPLFGNPPSAIIPEGKYKILARHSGKALAVYNASTENSASIVQWDYTSAPAANDEWYFTKIGTTGYYRITNVNSGKDMNVQGSSTEVGGLVVQFPYADDGYTNDVFGVIDIGGGYYKIIAKHSGLCLNVAGGNNINGAPLKQWDYQGTPNEQFQIVAIP